MTFCVRSTVLHLFRWMLLQILIVFLIGLFKLRKIGEDKDLSVMTSVELEKLFPGKKVETRVSWHYPGVFVNSNL